MTDRAKALEQFLINHGWGDAQRAHLAGDASNRRYERLRKSDGQNAVLMDAPPQKSEDTQPFIQMAQHLRDIDLSAPEIYAADTQLGFLLIEDLGDALFARLIAQDASQEKALYQAATDVLIQLHLAPVISLRACDADWLTEMTAPAFEWYAPDVDVAHFKEIFGPLAETLDTNQKVVILRDYHAENLIWLPERMGTQRVGLLDFQDALLGHPAYDLVSFLQDARRDVSPKTEAEMIAYYIAQSQTDPVKFRAAYALLGVQRNLRILGIFARLCIRDGKKPYVDLIPRVWDYMQRDLAHPDLSDLAQALKHILPTPTPKFLEHLKSQCATHPTRL